MGSGGLSGSDPFAYPAQPHIRRHGPMGYPKHGMYRNWLRDEFIFRCVYCLRRETWGTLKKDWQIDHVIPQSISDEGILDYDNLVYACGPCNHTKSNRLVPDPCKVAYGGCLDVDRNGEIHAINNNSGGVTLIETIGIDGEEYNEFRQVIFELRDELPVGGKAYWRLFGYPTNLPDLAKEPKPPGGNKRPKGIRESWYEKSKRGRLPRYY